MTAIWAQAALWLGLALVAQLVIGGALLAGDASWIKFLPGAGAIVLYAEDHGIDHIVVGHRGHGLFERWLTGSVARQVIACAPCAVTVVRPRA
ncbi:MAG: universal stress protein [Thiobacillus sp.]